MANSAIVGILRALLTANTAEYQTAMRGAAESARMFSKDMKAIGLQATQVGSALTKTLTLPIIGVGGSVAKLAMDFQSSFANVRKTVEGSEGELNALAQVFRSMAKEIPATTDELNAIAALGGQMGVPITQLEHFTRNVAALGVAVDGISTEDAAAGLAQIGNATGTGTTKIAEMASSLVHLGNKSNATEADILEFTKRLVGAGHSVGMTVPEVMALGTAMANVGINAEAGGTAMSTVISKISNAVSHGGESLRAFAEVAGLSAEEFAAVWQRRPVEAIDLFVQGLSSMRARGIDLNLTMGELGTEGIRIADTLKRLSGAGDGVAKSLVIANEGFTAGNKHLEEAEKKYQTVSNQLKLLWNAIKDVGITLGEALLPLIQDAIDITKAWIPVLEGVVKIFVGLPQPLQLAVVGIAGLLAVAGPLIYIFGQLALSASAVAGAFTAKGLAARGAAMSLTVTNAAALTLTGTLNALGVAIAAMPIAAATAGIGLLVIGLEKLYEASQRGKVANETAAAKQDAINKAIERGAAATITYTDAIKFNDEWMKKRLAAGLEQERQTQRTTLAEKTLADKIVDLNQRVVSADREISELSATARTKLVEAIRSGAFSVKELSEATGLSELALKRFEDRLKTTAKAGDTFGETVREVTSHAAPFYEVLRTIDGVIVDGAKYYLQHGAALEKVATMYGLTRGQIEAIASSMAFEQEVVDATSRSYAQRTAHLETLAAKSREWSNQGFAKNLAAEVTALRSTVDLQNQMTLSSFEYKKSLILRERDEKIAALDQHGAHYSDAMAAIVTETDLQMAEAEREYKQHLAEMELATNQWGNLFSKWLNQIPGLLQKAFTGGGGLGGALKAIAAGIGADIGGAIFGGAGFGNKLAQGLNKVGGFLGKGIGPLLGSLVPGIGTAIGALAGPLVSGIGKLFGKLFGQGEFDKVRKLRDEFNKTGSDLNKLGTDLRAAGLGHLLADIFSATKVKDFEAAVKRAQGELDKYKERLEVGRSTWERLRDVLQKYNIDVGKLGPAFRGQMLIEQTRELYEEWKLLEGAGVDVATIAKGMKDRINEMVQSAIRGGQEIPLEWKPLIQSLIDQGLLVDDNGEKYETLESTGITFAQTVSQALGGIESAIRDMIAALLEFLGLTERPPNWSGWVPPDPYLPPKEGGGGHTDPGTGQDVPDLPAAATGGLVTRTGIRRFGMGGMVPPTLASRWRVGTDTVPAMLTPGELILNEGQQAGVAAALAGGSGGSETIVIHTHVLLDGRQVGESVERIQNHRMRTRRRLRAG